MKASFMEAFQHVQYVSDDPKNIPPVPSANATNRIFPRLISLLKSLQAKVATLTAEKASDSFKNGTSNNMINPKTVHNFKHYYWYCGCCTHWRCNFKNKKIGHVECYLQVS